MFQHFFFGQFDCKWSKSVTKFCIFITAAFCESWKITSIEHNAEIPIFSKFSMNNFTNTRNGCKNDQFLPPSPFSDLRKLHRLEPVWKYRFFWRNLALFHGKRWKWFFKKMVNRKIDTTQWENVNVSTFFPSLLSVKNGNSFYCLLFLYEPMLNDETMTPTTPTTVSLDSIHESGACHFFVSDFPCVPFNRNRYCLLVQFSGHELKFH